MTPPQANCYVVVTHGSGPFQLFATILMVWTLVVHGWSNIVCISCWQATIVCASQWQAVRGPPALG